jgi:cysteine-rich secretory family protein
MRLRTGRGGWRLWVLLLALPLVLTSAPAGAQENGTSTRLDRVVDLINRERVSDGLLPLARSTELAQAAQAHSVDMVQHNYLDHTGFDGSQPQDRADRAGYHVPPSSGWIVVEVISAISADPQGPVDWWMSDSQHQKVLLNPRWREIGAGYAQGGDYGNYWTVLVGCRPGVLPTVVLDGVTYTHTEECGDPSVGAATATAQAALARPTAQATSTAVPPSTPTPPPGAAAPNVSLSVNAPAASAGSVVSVQWRGIASPDSTDWIGLYRPGDANTAYIAWQYVGCAEVPLDARPLGSCNVVIPPGLASGGYEFRIFRSNTYQPLTTPVPMQITGSRG